MTKHQQMKPNIYKGMQHFVILTLDNENTRHKNCLCMVYMEIAFFVIS
jgi:hypothetical protein